MSSEPTPPPPVPSTPPVPPQPYPGHALIAVPAKGRPLSFWLAWAFGLMLVLSLLINVVQLGRGLEPGGSDGYDETVLEGADDATDKVLTVPLSGMILEGKVAGQNDPVSAIRKMLKHARKDKSIKAILLEADTPGGGITASDVLYHELAVYKRDTKVPIVVLCKNLNASGGYYASMAADHIVAHETSLVGSIGVIAQFPNVAGLMQHLGVTVNTIKSQRYDGTESYKDIGSPYREMKPSERELMQGMVTRMWNRFVDVVATGRQGKLTREQIATLADGRIWTGREALDLKLVDSLGYREDAWHKAQELAKSPHASLVSWRAQSAWWESLLSSRTPLSQVESTLMQATSPLVTDTPRLLYMWNGL
jgi:protease IV